MVFLSSAWRDSTTGFATSGSPATSSRPWPRLEKSSRTGDTPTTTASRIAHLVAFPLPSSRRFVVLFHSSHCVGRDRYEGYGLRTEVALLLCPFIWDVFTWGTLGLEDRSFNHERHTVSFELTLSDRWQWQKTAPPPIPKQGITKLALAFTHDLEEAKTR